MAEGDRVTRTSGRRRSAGHAAVEIALMAPWIFFLFIGVLDFGFFAYAAIATQNAARAAAMYTSGGQSVAADVTGACPYVLEELYWLPNVRGNVTSCTAVPVTVTAQQVASPDGAAIGASSLTVAYQTIPLIPIPGLLAGQFTFTRTVVMRIKE